MVFCKYLLTGRYPGVLGEIVAVLVVSGAVNARPLVLSFVPKLVDVYNTSVLHSDSSLQT